MVKELRVNGLTYSYLQSIIAPTTTHSAHLPQLPQLIQLMKGSTSPLRLHSSSERVQNEHIVNGVAGFLLVCARSTSLRARLGVVAPPVVVVVVGGVCLCRCCCCGFFFSDEEDEEVLRRVRGGGGGTGSGGGLDSLGEANDCGGCASCRASVFISGLISKWLGSPMWYR